MLFINVKTEITVLLSLKSKYLWEKLSRIAAAFFHAELRRKGVSGDGITYLNR